MAAPRNLAEALGVKNPLQDQTVPQPEPSPVGDMDARQFARFILNSTQYRESVLRRVLMDELPAAVETKLMDYAWGRPTERIQIDDKSSRLEDMTSEELEQRALYLATRARQLRMNDESTARPSGDEDDRPPRDPSIH